MRIRSFKILSLAAFIKVNSANATLCAPGNGAPVVAIAQPGSVENCGPVSQPLIYDNTGNNNSGFSPDCIVPSQVPMYGGPGGYTPVQGVPSTPVVNDCVPVTPQIVTPPPPMATTIIGPPPGTPGTPGNGVPQTGGNPPNGVTPPPQKQEEQCTVTTKLDCEPVTPGQPDNTTPSPPPAGPPTDQPPAGPPAQQVSTPTVIHVTSVVPPPQRVVSIVPPPPQQVVVPPPTQVVPPPTAQVPCVPVTSGAGHNVIGGGSPTNLTGNIVGTHAPCVPHHSAPSTPVVPAIPVAPVPSGSSTGTPGTTTLGTGSGFPVVTPNGPAASVCSTPQNNLSAICGSNNAASTTAYASSNVGAACSLPNAEHCLTKALENIGKITPTEAASCVTSTKQPMVELGMMLPAAEKYVQAMNNPCVLN